MDKILLLLLAAFLMSCNNSRLNKDFITDRYDIDSRTIQNKKNVTSYDKFLLNYGVLRHRDYYNYEIDVKTFGEILTLSNELLEKVLPRLVETQCEANASIVNLHIVVLSYFSFYV